MELKKFYSAEEAARYAATITCQWKNEEGELWDAGTLIGVMSYADEENRLDEDDNPENYYVVDENGAVGYTDDDCDAIYWYASSTVIPEKKETQSTKFCPVCGAPLGEGWAFCDQCGRKLK